jgi:hypothetical protein
VAVIVGVLVWLRVDDRTQTLNTAGPATGITVEYERADFSEHAELTCPGATLDTGSRQATFETWADQAGRRWRNTVTYPDGTTRDLIVTGNPAYPDHGATRGDVRGATLGCAGGELMLVTEPGQGSLYSLNPPPPAGGRSPVLSYSDLGTHVAGDHADSHGRPAELWRQTVTGTISDGTQSHNVTQTTDWYVDSSTKRVLEQSFTNQVDGIGTATSTTTLIAATTITVPAEFFDEAGYSPIPNTELLSEPAALTDPPAPETGDSNLWTDPAGNPVPNGRNRVNGEFPLTLSVQPGAAHCDWQSVLFLDLVWPLGSVVTSYTADVRQYVWDPDATHAFDLQATPARGATPPPDAQDTGYQYHGIQLWIANSDADKQIYLRQPDGSFERWPRATTPILCA